MDIKVPSDRNEPRVSGLILQDKPNALFTFKDLVEEEKEEDAVVE
jgi:hypothetical protein